MKYGIVYTTFPYCAVVGYGICEIRDVNSSCGLRGGWRCMISVRKLRRESASFIVPHWAWVSVYFVSCVPAGVRHSHWSGRESIRCAHLAAVWVSAALLSAKMVWGLLKRECDVWGSESVV